MLTIKTINKHIQKIYPFMELIKGNDYFYFVCIDKRYESVLGNNLHTSVYVDKLNKLDLNSWMIEADNIVQNDEWIKL